MGLTFSFRINGGRAADACDMNPSLVGEAQKQDTVATQPSDLGRVATDSLAICKKSAKEPDSIPFGGEQEISRIQRQVSKDAPMSHHASHFPIGSQIRGRDT